MVSANEISLVRHDSPSTSLYDHPEQQKRSSAEMVEPQEKERKL